MAADSKWTAPLSDNERDAFRILQTWRDAREDPLLAPERAGFDWCSDATLLRYLVARKFDAEAALSMLKRTLVWRESTFPSGVPLNCPTCEANETAHCFVPVGWTSKGDIVIYGSPPRASDRSVAETVDHVVRGLEKAFLHPRTTSGQWIWLVDFSGFGLRHAMQARLGISFATTFEAHFPERLGKIVLVNPPGVFEILLAAIRQFADQRTLDKVVALSTSTFDEAFTNALWKASAIEDPGLQDWVREILPGKSCSGGLPPLGSRTSKGDQWKAVREVQLVPSASWVCDDEDKSG